MRLIAILFFLLLSHFLSAQVNPMQQKEIDSLNYVIAKAKNDTVVINAWKAWDDIIYAIDPNLDWVLNKKIDSLASLHLKKSLSSKERLFYSKAKGSALNVLGIAYYYKSNYDSAIYYYTQSLLTMQAIDDKQKVADALNNIGNVYKDQGIYGKAIEKFTQSLKYQEELKNKKGLAMCYNNIGLIYNLQDDYRVSLSYFEKSKQFYETIKDQKGIAIAQNNIGLAYERLGVLDSALLNFKQSLAIREAIEDVKGMGTSLNNIGNVYKEKFDFTKATEYLQNALIIRKKLGDKNAIANSYYNLGVVEYLKKNYSASINFCLQAYTIAKSINALNEMSESAQYLYGSYKALGKTKEALMYHEYFVHSRDSLKSTENQKAIIRQEYKYNYKKKTAADSVVNAKEREIKNVEIARQNAELRAKRNQQYALFGGLALVIVFAGFMYNRFKVTQKQKTIIEIQKQDVEHQKEIIQEKNKEIVDSITYARRLQEAILPPIKFVNQHLNENFIFYKPKDIVAGDFYWLETKDNVVFFAAADCTGHGVPGAMVSVVCSNALNRAVKEFGITEPGKILDKVRELVIETFERSESQVKDGMDISLCALDIENKKLLWSGANNPLWLFKNEENEIVEIKANKQPIGAYDAVVPFKTHEFSLSAGDTIYIFTDGYADQFGGPKGKKFKYNQLKEILVSVAKTELKNQKEIVSKSFTEWMGNMEQVDDVCIIGVRV